MEPCWLQRKWPGRGGGGDSVHRAVLVIPRAMDHLYCNMNGRKLSPGRHDFRMQNQAGQGTVISNMWPRSPAPAPRNSPSQPPSLSLWATPSSVTQAKTLGAIALPPAPHPGHSKSSGSSFKTVLEPPASQHPVRSHHRPRPGPAHAPRPGPAPRAPLSQFCTRALLGGKAQVLTSPPSGSLPATTCLPVLLHCCSLRLDCSSRHPSSRRPRRVFPGTQTSLRHGSRSEAPSCPAPRFAFQHDHELPSPRCFRPCFPGFSRPSQPRGHTGVVIPTGPVMRTAPADRGTGATARHGEERFHRFPTSNAPFCKANSPSCNCFANG